MVVVAEQLFYTCARGKPIRLLCAREREGGREGGLVGGWKGEREGGMVLSDWWACTCVVFF